MRQRNDTPDVLVTTGVETETGVFPAVAIQPGETVDYPHPVVGLTPVADEPAGAAKKTVKSTPASAEEATK